VMGDPATTRWTRRAIDDDRVYRRTALTIGLVGSTLASLVWAYIVFGIGSLGWLGVALPAGLVLAWAVTLFRVRRR